MILYDGLSSKGNRCHIRNGMSVLFLIRFGPYQVYGSLMKRVNLHGVVRYDESGNWEHLDVA